MRDLNIAYGNSCMAKKWSNKTITFGELRGRLENTIRTTETVEEYQKMKRAEREAAKDKGGFVGGQLKGGRRKRENVVSRSMLTMDVDKGEKGFIESYEMLASYASVLYTTHGHTPEAPRFRIIIPLTRDVTPDEYQAIARYFAAEWGIDQFDECSYRPHQLMYWPTTPSNGEYICEKVEGEWLDPDVFLSFHPNWQDCSLLPTSSRESEVKESNGKKMEDPEAKGGVVGLFCRAYPIREAIDTFLSNVYEPSANIPGRYSYIPADSSAGVQIFEEKFAHSFHASDPACGCSLNSFDLVRVHKFGDEDEKKSFQAMCDFAMSLDKVRVLAAEEKKAEADMDFDDGEDWREKLGYVGDVEMQKTITKDFLTHRSSINKGEAPRYYVKNHHVGIIDRVTWDKVQAMLYEKPRSDTTKGLGRKKAKSMKGSPFGNLRCGAILENGSNAGKPCGEGFFRVTYTGVANGYTDERSLKVTGEDTGEYLEKYSYSYPIWRCKRKMGEREDEPSKNGTPDQKMYSRSKKGCMSNAEKEAADKRCPSEIYHECALEQSFMELLYSMKRDYEQNGEASTIMAMFNKSYEQLLRQAKNDSISVQRVAAVNRQIEDLEERLQDVISHQVEALREAALEQSAELNERLSNGEITLDEIDTDIRSGLTPGSIGTSFYDFETEEGSEAQIYIDLVKDLQERLKTLRQERQTIEEE